MWSYFFGPKESVVRDRVTGREFPCEPGLRGEVRAVYPGAVSYFGMTLPVCPLPYLEVSMWRDGTRDSCTYELERHRDIEWLLEEQERMHGRVVKFPDLSTLGGA